MSPAPISIVKGRKAPLDETPWPLDLDALLPDTRAQRDAPRRWHVEIGFGKGRFLLRRARAEPDDAFLGIEMVSKYARLLADRAARHGANNLAVLRGEAQYLLTTYVPRGFADSLHVYFPDPWPKARHHRRRLFDPASVDLVLSVLKPGGHVDFATDFLSYGEDVARLLADAPQVAHLERHEGPWPDGARTNYEAKYEVEGRPILRLTATLGPTVSSFHPEGRDLVLAATAPYTGRLYARNFVRGKDTGDAAPEGGETNIGSEPHR